MKQYLDALKYVLDNGQEVGDRTGTGTLSCFGMQQRYNLVESFPAVTTKKLAWKACVGELLWFIEGSGDERRFLGFNNIHIFGMDGSFPAVEGGLKHASFHPNIVKDYILAEYEGKEYATTTAFLECARKTFHEIEQLPDTNITFYGEGLVQDMAKKKILNRKTKVGIAFHTNNVISDLYKQQNREMHEKIPNYGTVSALRHTDTVLRIFNQLKDAKSILDYGCGKGMLAKQLDFPIWEYDPAIPGKDDPPRPADLVVVIDVLEHIEPEYLDRVLEDIHRCTKKIVFFALGTEKAIKNLPDGRNSHLIIESEDWWKERLGKYFIFANENPFVHTPKCNEVTFVAAPKPDAVTKKNPGIVLNDEDCLCVVR